MIVKEFLACIVETLVDNPDEVIINEIEGERTCVLELKVACGDIGRIIGKQGSVIKAIRLLANAVAVKNNKRVTIEVIG